MKRLLASSLAFSLVFLAVSCTGQPPATVTLEPNEASRQIESLSQELQAKENQIAGLQQQLKDKDKQIVELEQRIQELQPQAIEVETTPTTPEGVIKIEATDLHRDGSENAIAAERKYEGQVLEVTGTVREVKRNYRGAYLSLEGDPEFIGWIDCFSLNTDWEDQISSVSIGQMVTIRGEWDEWSGFLLYLKNCSLIR